MGRHEIRLRRKRMTSRRIESHKNYYDVLRKHQRTSRMKRLIKLIVLLIFFVALIFFSYQILVKVDETQDNNVTPQKSEQSAYKTSRPGDLINFHLNT